MYGETYRADQNGTFTADFNVSALGNITDIYVFSSTGTGTGTGTGSFPLKNLISRTTYSGADLTNSRNFTLTANGARATVVCACGRLCRQPPGHHHPIWVNGPDVPAIQKVSAVKTILKSPQAPTVGSTVAKPATAIMTTTPWSGFLFADWELVGGNFKSVVKKNVNYIYTLTFTAPDGFVFDPALNAKNAIQVWNDGVHSKLTYRLHLKAKPSK